MDYYLVMFGVSLGLTILIEGIMAFILGLRGRYGWLVFALVNVISNPVAVFLNMVGGMYLNESGQFVAYIVIEICVFLTEALIYRSFKTCEYCRIRNPFLFSLVLNAVSCLSGVVIGVLI